jgi:L-lactate permease
MEIQAKLKFWSFLLALFVTLVAGWSGLKATWLPLFYLGIVGAIPMALIEGVHGGGTLAQDIAGGFVFVFVNVIFYYFVFRWILPRIFRMRREARGERRDS